MKFSFKQFIVPNFGKRLAFMLPAVILMGVFVSILVEIGWGTDPASFMNLNIAATLGWGLGNTEVLVYGLMLDFHFYLWRTNDWLWNPCQHDSHRLCN